MERLLGCFGAGGGGGEREQEQEPAVAWPEASRRHGGKLTLRRLSTANLRLLSLQDLMQKLETTKLHSFTLDELRAATKNFSTSNFLDEGGFGPVYRGFVDAHLRSGIQSQLVAVKHLDSNGVQGHHEWPGLDYVLMTGGDVASGPQVVTKTLSCLTEPRNPIGVCSSS